MLEAHRGSLVVQIVENLPAMWETWVHSLGQEDPWRREYFPLQYSCLENSMERGAWRATVTPQGCKELDST